MIDEQKLDRIFIIAKTLINLNNKKELTYKDINSYISSTEKFVKESLSSDERKTLFQNIEKHFSVQHIQGCVIYNDYENISDWYSNKKIEKPYFWPRYRKYLEEYSSLDANSIKLLDETTLPEIMNCLGNPREDFEGKRQPIRGLVMGDVQSGKTATYSGLICKAADAGYKVVILLAGITESLRRQTQERIDEGVVGITSRKNNEDPCRVGVGLDNKELRVTSFTTQYSDYIGHKDNIITSLKSHSSLVLFVIKKNVSVLSSLYTWLKNNNHDKSTGYIDVPLLLIDDEADNASLNTNKDELNPTKINSKIRNICNLFKNASYVGFTATPFANVFINPKSVDAMKRADLFPENFIYVLPTPSTYIGADKIFYEDGKYHTNIKHIVDINEPDYSSEEYKEQKRNNMVGLNEGYFYYRHSKEWDGKFPSSLTDAIYCFFIANIIRDLRGNSSRPRSMLINMSRYVKVQNVIKSHVELIYNEFINCVRTDFKGDNADTNLPLYKRLRELWKKYYYSSTTEMFDSRILNKENILNAVKDIKVVVVNGSKGGDKLDYQKNPSLRIIAVGGIALSRGLTLEGLVTSYFYRNTATFDVLMQMGRWFGYRPGYEDIFQIWTSVESANWYSEIARATDELKGDLRSMYLQHLTPKDFGIKVRDDCEELGITATNKMRSSRYFEETISFYGNLHETPYVSSNVKLNTQNLEQINRLATTLCEQRFQFIHQENGKVVMVNDVPKSIVLEFTCGITCLRRNPSFDPANIKDFIEDTNTTGLELWDVVFLGGDSKSYYNIKNLGQIACAERTIHVEHNAIVLNVRRRMLSPSAGRLGLSMEQIDEAKKACRRIWKKEDANVERSIPTKAYFEYLPNRKPILIILLVVPKRSLSDEGEKLSLFKKALGNSPIAGFAMGFPGIKTSRKVKRYRVNSVYRDLYLEDLKEEQEADDEE